MKKVSFVIPCYRSANTIGVVVDEIRDTEKAVGDDERQRQQRASAHERKYADEKTDADDGKVFEFPQPERRLGREVIRVDVHCVPPKQNCRRGLPRRL